MLSATMNSIFGYFRRYHTTKLRAPRIADITREVISK